MTYCFRNAKNINPDDILRLVVDKKNGDYGSPIQTNAANDYVLHIYQEGTYVTFLGMSECHYNGKCVKLHGLKLILFYYLANLASVLILSHFWWSVPVLSMVYRK